MRQINTRVAQKIDTSENWSKAVNFIPLKGEIIVYSDLNKIKIGDGETNVNNLAFYYNTVAQIHTWEEED